MAKLYLVIGVTLIIAFFAMGYHWYNNQPLTLNPTPPSEALSAEQVKDAETGPPSATMALNERKQIASVFITPLEIIEDSRCPIDTVCIQAGTIRIKARVESDSGTSVVELKIGTSVNTGTESILLTEAQPAPKASDPAPLSAYRFTIRARDL
jgi:hypothetical protein